MERVFNSDFIDLQINFRMNFNANKVPKIERFG
jgi:hypothetical protein